MQTSSRIIAPFEQAPLQGELARATIRGGLRTCLLHGPYRSLGDSVPFALAVKSTGDEGEPPPMWTEAMEVLDDLIAQVSLSLTLAIRREPPVTCTRGWHVLPDPLSPGPAATAAHASHSHCRSTCCT
jgi:hypothetical protein